MGLCIIIIVIVLIVFTILECGYEIYICFQEDKLRGKNRIIIRWPKPFQIVFLIFILGIGGTLVALAIVEKELVIALCVFIVTEVPIVLAFLYFCRRKFDFDFTNKTIAVYFTLKKKRIYTFEEITGIEMYPASIDIYFVNGKKIRVYGDMIGSDFIVPQFIGQGYKVVKKDRYDKPKKGKR